jgi:cyclophilin family peptidyl-prolyl cis-trans isomerase/HEAT repeat protein
MSRTRIWVASALLAAAAVAARAQAPSRMAILIAEDHRAPTARDLATIRGGLHSRDLETARVALRALGRLERPELIPDLLPLLKSPTPEIRAEAATAIGQAAQGWKRPPARASAVRRTGGLKTTGPTLAATATALDGRLPAEEDPNVRAALCQTIGRLPYTTADEVQDAESTLTETLAHEDSTDGRLGVAQGLEALVRLNRKIRPPSAEAIDRLVDLASGGTTGAARIRRLALEALITADAVTDPLIMRTARDPDPQLRRLAMRAAGASARSRGLGHSAQVIDSGLSDPSAMVRYEALAAQGNGGGVSDAACAAATAAVGDRDMHVVLLALDQLAACASSPDAIAALERAVNESPVAPRMWHRPAHALVALARPAPKQAAAALARFVDATVWQLRMYAARAATLLGDRAVLEKLAADQDDNVCEAAIAGLSKVAGHAADPIYAAALGRRGYQAVREAAIALADERPQSSTDGRSSPVVPEAPVSALKSALDRLNAEAHDNSRDARAAVVVALEAYGVRVGPLPPVRELNVESDLTAEELRRLASARARFTVRGVGTFELALFTGQAPATATRFARLAQSGYYNGLTFHRVVPNFVIQGGSPGANEYVGDASYMRDEVGSWPHVRGAVGISTRGRDTGDAQIFIDLVDNPRLDHEYTVFAQVLNGMDVVDQVLEGDVIEKVEILTTP